jgi:CheY-like chemotaxis protein
MVMIALPTKVLLLSASARALVDALSTTPDAYEITVIDETSAAMEMLRDADYDMIILDDALLAADTLRALREIKRRRPLTPVLVMTSSSDSAYYIDLLETGADDILSDSLYEGELHRRLRLVLQQRRQNLALARRSSNLQTLVTLARRLHAATDPRSLLVPLTWPAACSACTVWRLPCARVKCCTSSPGAKGPRPTPSSRPVCARTCTTPSRASLTAALCRHSRTFSRTATIPAFRRCRALSPP